MNQTWLFMMGLWSLGLLVRVALPTKWTLLLSPLRRIPGVEQLSIALQCISEPTVTNNPLTNLEILYTNADQLLNKIDDLSTIIAGG